MPSTRWSMSMPPGARYAEPDQPGAVPVHERPERPGLPARTRHDPNPPDGAAAPISMDKVGRRNYADNNRGADGAVGLSARMSAAVGAAITSGAACGWSSIVRCPFRAKRHSPGRRRNARAGVNGADRSVGRRTRQDNDRIPRVATPGSRRYTPARTQSASTSGKPNIATSAGSWKATTRETPAAVGSSTTTPLARSKSAASRW
jgi:hypothetical protein